MPSTIFRFGLAGRETRPTSDGSSGAICAHCSSVNECRLFTAWFDHK
jgi:hypothetical protein